MTRQAGILIVKLLAWAYIVLFLFFSVTFLLGKAGAQGVAVYDDAKNPNNGKVAQVVTKTPEKPKPPTLSDSDKFKIRELQLKDSQITVEIQKRQLELYQLRDLQTQNTSALNDLKNSLCKPADGDKNFYAVDAQNVQCIQLDQPKK